MEEKVVAVMNIKLVDMPIVEDKFDLNMRRTILFGKQIVNDRMDKKLTILKKHIWTALKRNVTQCQKQNRLTSLLLRNLRKFHLWHGFKKMHK